MKTSLTINPVQGGTDVIAVSGGVFWSGTERGLDGQDITVLGYRDTDSRVFQGAGETSAGSGTWSMTASYDPLNGDGVYSISAVAGPFNAPIASSTPETVVIANFATPFSVVGMAFLDANANLSSASPVPKASLYRDFNAEVAGLTTLHQHDDFPNKPFHTLISDINAEIHTLDFTPSLPTATASGSVITKLVADQSAISGYVHDTPSLVALMTPGTGW
jgi:hypothetical protein